MNAREVRNAKLIGLLLLAAHAREEFRKDPAKAQTMFIGSLLAGMDQNFPALPDFRAAIIDLGRDLGMIIDEQVINSGQMRVQ